VTKLRLTARAEIPTGIIMWFGGITAVLIAVFWLMTTVYPIQSESRKAGSDLDQIQNSVNEACNSDYYAHLVNPSTEKGYLVIKNTSVCLNTSNVEICRSFMCKTDSFEEIALANITNVRIQKFNRTGSIIIGGIR